ncbi:hypothetical protein K491DRAFT_680240 [Lophiostoma macrostomum CBS 122681]|uniref:F-box domain-containing protein n=1 Tax=Lophiostoma macrostomum CBS 122681 TaxID=1314788 RepID=A0A6A6T207_9PLEO|nr:hypothetical protein K491DRAFT_680240 [Lophiostoma macrostomum CBS 122681]
MNHLPTETLAAIVEELASATPRHRLANYAAISKDWQVAVERVTFRTLRIASPRLHEYETAFAGENIRRRYFLSDVALKFELPSLTINEGCSMKSIPDRMVDGTCFSKSLHLFFHILNDIWQRAELTIGQPFEEMDGLSPISALGITLRVPRLRSFKLAFKDAYAWGYMKRRQRRKVYPLFAGEDPLLEALRKCLTTMPQMAKFHITGCFVIAPNFFESLLHGSAVFPQIREFSLEFSYETADGRRYFQEVPGYVRETDDSQEATDYDNERVAVHGDTPRRVGWVDEMYFLGVPNTETIYPLIIGAAQFAHQYSKLTVRVSSEDRFWCVLEDDTLRDFGFQYLRSGTPVQLDFLRCVSSPNESLTIHENRL